MKTPEFMDTDIPVEIMRHIHELNVAMDSKGFREWEIGPIASRSLVINLRREIERLKAQLAEAREALEDYAQCSDGCTCGDGWSHGVAERALASMNKESIPSSTPPVPAAEQDGPTTQGEKRRSCETCRFPRSFLMGSPCQNIQTRWCYNWQPAQPSVSEGEKGATE